MLNDQEWPTHGAYCICYGSIRGFKLYVGWSRCGNISDGFKLFPFALQMVTIHFKMSWHDIWTLGFLAGFPFSLLNPFPLRFRRPVLLLSAVSLSSGNVWKLPGTVGWHGFKLHLTWLAFIWNGFKWIQIVRNQRNLSSYRVIMNSHTKWFQMQ